MYDTIYHISDIHIRLNERHQEYREVFEQLYKKLRRKKKNSLIVLTGDILHSKTDLTPECIDLTIEFFKNLASIMPTILIAGNHDANLANSSTMDALSPLVKHLDNFHYLKDTDVYDFENLSFAVVSVFDNKFPDINLHPKDSLKIALHHGTLDGAVTDVGFKLKHQRKPSDFVSYDLVLLGDIHCHQFLTPRMEYSGSLIQQNFGEKLSGHGYVKWDLKKMKGKFFEVPNNYGFVTFKLEDNVLSMPTKIPEKPTIRMIISGTTSAKKHQVVEELQAKYDTKIVIKTVKKKASKSKIITTPTTENKTDLVEHVLVNQLGVTNENLVKKVQEKHKELFIQDGVNSNSTQWELVSLSFSNLFCYQEDNCVDFTKLENVVGLLAPNHTGKSALVDIILYSLFDNCSRGRTVSDYLNRNASSFQCCITFKTQEATYRIEKIGKVKKGGQSKDELFRKIEVHIVFSKKEEQGWTTLNESTAVKTKKKIFSIIGDYNDFLLTSIALQNKGLGLLALSQSERKNLISKLFRLDIYDTLSKKVRKQVLQYKAQITELDRMLTRRPEELRLQLKEHQTVYDQLSTDLLVSEAQAESFPEQIIALNKKLIPLETIKDIDPKQMEKINEVELEDYPNIKKKFDQKITVLKAKIKQILTNDPRVITDYKLLNSTLKQKKKELNTIKSKEAQLKQQLKVIRENAEEDRCFHQYKQKQKNLMEKITKGKKLLSNIESLKVNQECNCCLDNLKHFNPEKERLLHQLPSLEMNLQQAQHIVSALKEYPNISSKMQKLEKEHLKAKHSVDSIPDEILELDSRQIELERKSQEYKKRLSFEKELEEAHAEISTISTLAYLHENKIQIEKNKKTEDKIKLLNQQYQMAKEKVNTLRSKVSEYNTKIKLCNQDLEIQVSLRKRYAELLSDYEVHNLLQKCYHVDGIPCLLMAKNIPAIEKEINHILHNVASFEVQMKLVHNSIDLYKKNDDNTRVHLECTSGFEQFISALAIRIALRNYSKMSQPNFIILDEGFSSADEKNVKNLTPIFDYLREHFKFIIMISHLQELKKEADMILPLENNGVYTKINN